MYNSREIGELRADVAVNCRTLIERAAARGLPVLVVQTVRDAEYQRYLVSMGYAARTATVPTRKIYKDAFLFIVLLAMQKYDKGIVT